MTDTVARPDQRRATPEDRRTRRDRRRFARRQWRRRWRVWRYALVGLLLLGLVATATWAVYGSDLLTVEAVEVSGGSALSDQDVIDAAAVPLGVPLATADLRSVELRVGALAQVRSVEVTRQWPHTIAIDVQERIPVAVVAIGDELRGLDRDGQVLDALSRAPSGLPRVESTRAATSEALAEAAHVVAALPSDLSARVDHVEVETVDQITLVLRDQRVVRWGSAEQSEQKAAVLAVLLDQPPSANYDVSVPGNVTTSG